jgi:transposase
MSIPGIGPAASAVIISGIGTDMSFFPPADHLASRAGPAPAGNEPGGRRRPARTRHGGQHLADVLAGRARAASRTRTRPGARSHRLARRLGGHRSTRAKNKAAVAVAHTLLLIIYRIPGRRLPCDEPGEDSCTRRQDPGRHNDKLIARLAKPGCKVTVEPARAA